MADDLLQKKIQKAGQKVLADSQLGDTTRPMDSKSSSQYLQEFESFAKDPTYQHQATPESQQSLQEAIAQARKLYEEQATKNEWLEVAQLLGKTVAQFGAAATAKPGHDMSNLQFAPGIDYDKRTDRAYRQYADTVSLAKEMDRDRKSSFESGEKAKNENYDKQQDYLQTAIRASQEAESDSSRANRERSREKDQAKREDRTQDKMDLSELNREETALRKVMLNRQTLANQLQAEDDLSPKAAAKLQEKYGKVAADADLDLAGVQSELESTDKPGLWGKNPDKDSRKQILDAKVNEIRNLLEGIRARKQDLLRRNSPGSATLQGSGSGPAVVPAPTGPQPGDIVDGYKFKGGDPAKQENWEKVN